MMNEQRTESSNENTTEQTTNSSNVNTVTAEKGTQIDNNEDYVSTMKVTCRTCRNEIILSADDLRREPKFFGKDPLMFAFICPICERVDFRAYYEISVKVIQEYYYKYGK